MEFYYSDTQNAVPSPNLSLNTVFHVFADHTYNVTKSPLYTERLVLIRTKAGVGIIETRKGVFSLTSGTLIVLKYDDILHYYPENNEWHFWWFEYNCKNTILENNTVFNLPLIEHELTRFNKCLQYLRYSWNRDHASALFLLCLYEWRTLMNDIGKTKYVRIFEEADKWMHENISAFQLERLSEKLKISDRTLRTVFKKIAGKSPKVYFDNLRIQMGAQMLRDTLLNVSEIAELLGFSSPYHFSRAFSKYHNIPPSKFRNML